MNIRFILVITLFVVMSMSCMTNGFYLENKKNYVFLKNYSNDTLVLKNYILFGTHPLKRLDYATVRIDNDSIFNVFISSLNKTQIPILIENENKNIVTKTIIDDYHSRTKHINVEALKRYAKTVDNYKTKKVIIPCIKYNFHEEYSEGVGLDVYYVCNISLTVFIVENDKVIYYKKMRHTKKVDSDLYPYFYNDFNIPIPKEHWDGLVREVMKEYIERLNNLNAS